MTLRGTSTPPATVLTHSTATWYSQYKPRSQKGAKSLVSTLCWKRKLRPTSRYSHVSPLRRSVKPEVPDRRTRSSGSHFSPLDFCVLPSFSQMKNNPNQVCWLLEKVPRSSDTENGFSTFQQFLDNQQYTNRGILRYEKMFGAGYVSTGGPSTTKVGMKSGEYQWIYVRCDYYFPWCIT